eukprot:scaffold91144_cov67-Phaeocystis_antarctica.AAC.6
MTALWGLPTFASFAAFARPGTGRPSRRASSCSARRWIPPGCSWWVTRSSTMWRAPTRPASTPSSSRAGSTPRRSASTATGTAA